ncbi:MAG: hypothetical protein ACKO40_03435 [Planctomycetaceae bacterium]
MHSMTTFRRLAAGVALAAMLGCGPTSSTVSGTVTFNGEPVASGAISLFPTDGKGSPAGGLIKDGRYTVTGVTPGEKTVQLSSPVIAGTRKDDYGNESRIAEELMPAAWGRGSQHTITVTAGSNTQDFAVEGPDPRKKK